ncbi:hypothetical protein KKG51_01120, partial [Patescibacteria group bacterium]|nr:hypothetical protein [Patescibacteria group bacterium]
MKKHSPYIFLLLPIIILFIIKIITGKSFEAYFINLDMNDWLLLSTYYVIWWYTFETYKIRKQTVLQTEMEQMPILVLNIQKGGVAVKPFMDQKYQITEQVNNSIIGSDHYLTVKNLGKGPAINLELKSENFVGVTYQERFLIPSMPPVTPHFKQTVGLVVTPSQRPQERYFL